MTDKVFCPRALEDGGGPNSSWEYPLNGELIWRPDSTCSYCGSLSEEKFFEFLEKQMSVVPTDKNYKARFRSGEKFYFQHLSEDGRQKFVRLLNQKKILFDFPGYFYVLPFFLMAMYEDTRSHDT